MTQKTEDGLSLCVNIGAPNTRSLKQVTLYTFLKNTALSCWLSGEEVHEGDKQKQTSAQFNTSAATHRSHWQQLSVVVLPQLLNWIFSVCIHMKRNESRTWCVFRMTKEDLKMFFSSAGRLGLTPVCTAGGWRENSPSLTSSTWTPWKHTMMSRSMSSSETSGKWKHEFMLGCERNDLLRVCVCVCPHLDK